MKIGEDLIVTTALLKRFILEATTGDGDGRHYGVIRRDNGGLLVYHPGSPELAPEQMMSADDVLRWLNRELHHDGAWVVVFTNPQLADITTGRIDPGHAEYGRYVLLWLDQDGDVQIPIEWAAGEGGLHDFSDVMLAGILSTLSKAETAWNLWHTHMREVLDPRPDQLFKAAQGQPAPSTRH
jgi:hypothetical protein